ncbi:FimD/PapC N-terminal domain-containing protein, partial [Morganella morganii]
AEACFTPDQIETLGIIPDSSLGAQSEISKSASDDNVCHPLNFYVSYAKSYYNTADLVLNLTVPQASLTQQYSDYIDPSRWEEGVTALFVDYNLNSYV